MRQIAAILLDSYRELRSRSLFWISLAISILTPLLLLGLIGFDETGWKVLWFSSNESPMLREGTPGARDLVLWLFGGALIWWWLTWGAIVMALIATSSTIPEFVTSGSIDLSLAKPIGRMKLYLTKLTASTLFVLMQAIVTVALAYVLMGLRFGHWIHEAWLAVPLVMLQYFYLFVVMSFVGLMTRSTLASLLAILVFWGVISLVQFASNQLDRAEAELRSSVELAEQRIADIRTTASEQNRELTSTEDWRVERAQSQIDQSQSVLSSLGRWPRIINAVELVVPKTGDIQKIIAESVDAPTFGELIMSLQGFDSQMMAEMTGSNDPEQMRDMQEAGVEGSRAVRSVNAWVSIGSSLGFTLLVLLASLWIFMRRDF